MSIAGVPVGSKSTVVLVVVIYTGRDEPRGVAVVVSSIASAAVVVSSIASAAVVVSSIAISCSSSE
jgi:hypothetical protein